MSIAAQLRDSVTLPGGDALVNGRAVEGRADGSRRALLRNGSELEVYDLYRVFAGEPEPIAVFPLPWPEWDGGVYSVGPDRSFAVFSGRHAVRAVSRAGKTLWDYRHGCRGSEVDHPHSGRGREACRGFEHGSCRVSDDGRHVWVHVVFASQEHDRQEFRVVLDARDGRELARLPLDSEASGSHHLAHPDGVHVGLCIGMGQDGVLLHWARRDGERLIDWNLDEGLDRILADVHPAHSGFLTVEHYGADLRLHALDGTVLAIGVPEPADDEEDPSCWDHNCGFVDADTVIATTVDSDGEPERARHWLLDARTLEVRGPLAYPVGPLDSYVRPLGDGTWLTYDGAGGRLDRWSEAAPRAR
ncbi:hypothetical protein OG948_40990 (plasmid) [Embleya sp. NBC_00888]|uniref:hypothetical protein n=1 Tax=Embleya sp. NBC_00888 TaxID=2975960 RepID=UPI002F90CD43|nr:hypothetical protein OG948_40990 [Embleya sp. NBC_00888]